MGTGTVIRARIRRRGLTSRNFKGGCHCYGHKQQGDTLTLRLRRGNGRVSLLGFFLFGGFLVAILLVSVGAIVLIVNVIIVALGKEMGVKVNK